MLIWAWNVNFLFLRMLWMDMLMPTLHTFVWRFYCLKNNTLKIQYCFLLVGKYSALSFLANYSSMAVEFEWLNKWSLMNDCDRKYSIAFRSTRFHISVVLNWNISLNNYLEDKASRTNDPPKFQRSVTHQTVELTLAPLWSSPLPLLLPPVYQWLPESRLHVPECKN